VRDLRAAVAELDADAHRLERDEDVAERRSPVIPKRRTGSSDTSVARSGRRQSSRNETFARTARYPGR